MHLSTHVSMHLWLYHSSRENPWTKVKNLCHHGPQMPGAPAWLYIKPMAHTLVPWNHLYSVLTWGSATGTQSIPPSAWPAMPGRWQQDSGSRGGNPKLRKITKKGLHNQSGKGHSKLRPIHLRGLWRAHQSHPLLYLRAQGLWFGFIKVWLFFWAHEIG